jgi:hypothetical protein
MRYLTPFGFLPKAGRLRTETKGNTVTFSNNVTQVILFIVILNSSCNFICEISQRIMFHRLEKLLVQIRAPAANCLRNPRIACNADLFLAIPLGELKFE